MPFDARPEIEIDVPTRAPTVRDVIKRAREILSDPKRWTQNTFAVNKEGKDVYSYADEAVAWCAVGAIERAAYELTRDKDAIDSDLAHDAENTLRKRGSGLISLNDHRGHKAVLKRFDGWLKTHAEKK